MKIGNVKIKSKCLKIKSTIDTEKRIPVETYLQIKGLKQSINSIECVTKSFFEFYNLLFSA